MQRITIKDLRSVCARLNRATNSPMDAYTRSEDGKFKANIGNYHISQAYGGYCLHRMHNEGGGVSTPLNCGHIPARELYNNMLSFIYGVESTK